MPEQQNIAVLARFIDEVINQGRLEVADEIVHEDFIELDPLPGQQQGREGAGVSGPHPFDQLRVTRVRNAVSACPAHDLMVSHGVTERKPQVLGQGSGEAASPGGGPHG